ncbi:MAG: hypothetical protein CMN72_10945 [Sphingomonas sp.]|nr:hypothetical protein [Sphingomonas sp.]
MRFTLCLVGTSIAASPALAGDLAVKVDIPQLRVAEYHRPYVALWIEDAKGNTVANLANWYQIRRGREDGTKWLPDLRTWWRHSGRSLKLPVDGVSGPTRAPGSHVLRFAEESRALPKLAPGNYTLMVEAAREVGGRELVSIPFRWGAAGSRSASGSSELGTVTLQIKP